jgi:bifunctional UDP-N-acetylglucosamine pyrophosphorylase/glucosamine-1-phosphate N-acetyltransferase
MIFYSIRTALDVTSRKPVVVVGHAAEAVRETVGDIVEYVSQEPQLGTGHAVQQAEHKLLGSADQILVMYADMPLLRVETLKRLIEKQQMSKGALTILTVISANPRGFGRIVRKSTGEIQRIVEEAQATDEQLAIRELNTGVYCFDAKWLWDSLPRITLSQKGEYYLTDLVEIATRSGNTVQSITLEDQNEVIGVNNRVHLAETEKIMRQRINNRWMLEGVTIIDPERTYIEADVSIGQDTIIWPNTYLQKETIIGRECELGPNSIIHNTKIGDRCKVLSSITESAVLEDDVDIGPFGHLRKGAHLAKGVHMGNFGEVKNSYLGPGTKMGHFSYLGDASLGSRVNIGAGTITCNYDGEKKHHTEIGDGVFVGSDTMLVAPVRLGKNSRTGAGAVVTKNVAPNTVVVGIPARAIRKLDESD